MFLQAANSPEVITVLLTYMFGQGEFYAGLRMEQIPALEEIYRPRLMDTDDGQRPIPTSFHVLFRKILLDAEAAGAATTDLESITAKASAVKDAMLDFYAVKIVEDACIFDVALPVQAKLKVVKKRKAAEKTQKDDVKLPFGFTTLDDPEDEAAAGKKFEKANSVANTGTEKAHLVVSKDSDAAYGGNRKESQNEDNIF